MQLNYDQLLDLTPDRQLTTLRLENLLQNTDSSDVIGGMDPVVLKSFLNLIGTSTFLYQLLCRHPEVLTLTGKHLSNSDFGLQDISTIEDLRRYKYRLLYQLSWMDVSGLLDYTEILSGLTQLAESIIGHCINLVGPAGSDMPLADNLAVFGLGKLGASELNYSSDVDLIFTSRNIESSTPDSDELQSALVDGIRALCQALETRTEEGFLYRVDLKLRPWGSSGPLFMSVDATEQYYEASSEPWERFAWLRSRVVAGADDVGKELQQRLRPFVFRRSLSTEDLERFLQIKNDMSKARIKKGRWNVKVGEGGIRDIEFFAQMLQIVNGGENKALQITNTLEVINALVEAKLLDTKEALELRHSYLFLRRLENRLQMIDEKQTHDLSDSAKDRLFLARSLGVNGESDDEILDNFETQLFVSQSIAKNYFNRILPD